MTEILEGNLLAKAIREKAKTRIDADADHPPGLAVILVGDNAASSLYVSLKEQAAKDVGIYVEKFVLPESSTEELVERINVLNKRPDINGILVQLPLPAGIDTSTVINTIHPTKDVDAFHEESRRGLRENEPMLVPPVTLAIMRLIQATRQPVAGKNAVIISNSPIFAEPLVELLKDAQVTATFVERSREGLSAISRAADIVIVAVGDPGFLKPDMVHDGAIIIDVGTNRQDNGKVIGDVHPDVLSKASFVSKNPGGVGPLTVAYLLMNVIKAKELQERATK